MLKNVIFGDGGALNGPTWQTSSDSSHMGLGRYLDDITGKSHAKEEKKLLNSFWESYSWLLRRKQKRETKSRKFSKFSAKAENLKIHKGWVSTC